MEAQALFGQGWTISAIARHLGINRRTVRSYLSGQRVPGRRAGSSPQLFTPFAEYARLRLAADPHLWATTLFDELSQLGYPGAYPSLTRALRAGSLRPHCEPCSASRGRQDKIDPSGIIAPRHNSRLHHIGIGRRHAGTRVLVLVHDLQIRVLTEDGELLRELTLDPAPRLPAADLTVHYVPRKVRTVSRDITARRARDSNPR